MRSWCSWENWVRYRWRRILLFLAVDAVVYYLGFIAGSFGGQPTYVWAAGMVPVMATLVVDYRMIFAVTAQLENFICRSIAFWFRPRFRTALLLGFALYSIALGVVLGATASTLLGNLDANFLVFLASFFLLIRVRQVLFTSNIHGPMVTGYIAIAAAAAAPPALDLVHSTGAVPTVFVANALVIYGIALILSQVYFTYLVAVQQFREISSFEPDGTGRQGGLVGLLQWTEWALNHNRRVRGNLGLAASWLIFAAGGWCVRPYRREFFRIIIKQFYAQDLDRLVVLMSTVTTTSKPELARYLRTMSLLRMDRVREAEQLLKVEMDEARRQSTTVFPMFYLAKAISCRERGDILEYRRWALLANQALDEDDGRVRCRAAIINEKAKVVADGIKDSLVERGDFEKLRDVEELKRRFKEPLDLIETAKRQAIPRSMKLYADVRATEGYVRMLTQEYSEAWTAFADALACDDNLEARYYLGNLLMLESFSFAHAKFQFQRIVRQAPSHSRLHKLAAARLKLSKRATEANEYLGNFTTTFKILAFTRTLLAHTEILVDRLDVRYVKWRWDQKKISEYQSTWKKEAPLVWGDVAIPRLFTRTGQDLVVDGVSSDEHTGGMPEERVRRGAIRRARTEALIPKRLSFVQGWIGGRAS